MIDILYHGKKFTVPNWTKYVTHDLDGTVTAWEKAPDFADEGYWYGYAQCMDIGILDLPKLQPTKIEDIRYEM